jgi:hypothetical protein
MYIRNYKTHGLYNSENLIISHAYNNKAKGFTLEDRKY